MIQAEIITSTQTSEIRVGLKNMTWTIPHHPSPWPSGFSQIVSRQRLPDEPAAVLPG